MSKLEETKQRILLWLSSGDTPENLDQGLNGVGESEDAPRLYESAIRELEAQGMLKNGELTAQGRDAATQASKTNGVDEAKLHSAASPSSPPSN